MSCGGFAGEAAESTGERGENGAGVGFLVGRRGAGHRVHRLAGYIRQIGNVGHMGEQSG